LQQWHQRGCKNKEAHDFAITRNLRVALQEQFADGERARHDLAEEHNSTAAVEHRINGVVGGAIRTEAQRWRRVNRIDRSARTQLATGDNRGRQCGSDRNVQAHPRTEFQQARDGCQALLCRCGHRAERKPHAVGHAGICVERCAAKLGTGADRIGVQRNERLFCAIPRFECANEREGGGIGAISGRGSKSFSLGPTLHKDAPLSHGDQLIK
jgi:hypothetical protein